MKFEYKPDFVTHGINFDEMNARLELLAQCRVAELESLLRQHPECDPKTHSICVWGNYNPFGVSLAALIPNEVKSSGISWEQAKQYPHIELQVLPSRRE